MASANRTISTCYPNNLNKIICDRFPDNLLIKGFKPTPELLYFLNMTASRFWKIYRCETVVTTVEAQRIAQWLKVEIDEIFPELQKPSDEKIKK